MGWKAKFHPNYSTPSESLAPQCFSFRRDLRVEPSRISSFSPLNIFPRIFLSFSFFSFSRLRGSFFTHDRNPFVLRSESRIYVHPCAHFCCAFNERSTREIIKSLINKRMLINSINWIRYNSIESSNSIFPILWIIKARSSSIGEKLLSKFLKRRKKNYKKLVMA